MGGRASSSKPARGSGPKSRKSENESADKAPAAQSSSEDNYLPPDKSLAYLVREVHRAYLRSLVARIGKYGITSGMWWFLRVLWTEDGLSQAELSKRLAVKGPTTVRAIDRLQKFGLVIRRQHPEDKRMGLIFLTSKGNRMRDTLMPLAIETNRIGIRALTCTEERIARTLLGRVLEQLTKDQLAFDHPPMEKAPIP